MKIKYLITMLIVFLLIQSCSLNSTRRKHRSRPRLSSAMKKASNNNHGSRVVGKRVIKDDDDEDEENNSLLNILLSDDDDSDEEEVNRPALKITPVRKGRYNPVKRNTYEHVIFGIKTGSGLVEQEGLYGFNHFEFFFGKYQWKNKSSFLFSLGFANSPIQEDSNYDESLSGGLSILNLDLTFRFYTTPSYTFLGNYFYVGGGMSLMSWNYKNSVQIEEYDEDGYYTGTTNVSSDRLVGLNLFCGIGFNIIQTRYFHLGGEISPGVIFWGWETNEGLSNDVFDNFATVKASLIFNLIGNK